MVGRCRRHAFAAAGLAAAGLAAAATPARAADLEPEPIEYVRACKAAGEGYLVIPGGSTCISVGGYVLGEYMVFESNRASRQPGWYSPAVPGTIFRTRFTPLIGTRLETDLGPAETHFKIEITQDNDDFYAEYKEAYLTFAGITAGRGQSLYDFYTGNTFEDYFEPAWSDFVTNHLGYTLALRDGLSLTVALEDAVTRDIGIKHGGPDRGFGPGYGGPKTPDAVASLSLSPEWGAAQLMGAVHQLRAGRGTAGTATGWAVGGGVTFNLPALAEGDSLSLQANLGRGALAYAANDPIGPGRGFAGADAVVVDGGRRLVLGRAWSVSGGVTHNWTERLNSTVEASYLAVDQAGSRFDFSNVDFQANLIFLPVDQLQIGIETEYKFIGRRARADGSSLMTMFVIQRDF
jgi:opacity protein-like surface antigen